MCIRDSDHLAHSGALESPRCSNEDHSLGAQPWGSRALERGHQDCFPVGGSPPAYYASTGKPTTGWFQILLVDSCPVINPELPKRSLVRVASSDCVLLDDRVLQVDADLTRVHVSGPVSYTHLRAHETKANL